MNTVFSPVTLHLALLEAAARGPGADPHGDPLAGPRPAAESLVVHPALPLLPRGGGGLASLQTPGPCLQQGRGVTAATLVPVPVTRGSLVPGAGAGARVSASTRARDWMCCCRVSRLLLTRLVLVSPQRLYRGRLQLVTSSSPVTSVMLMAHFFSYTSSHLFSCTGISQSVMS